MGMKRYSFEIKDAEGMNKALAGGFMVSAAGVCANEGWVNFAVDDGEPLTIAETILDHKKAMAKDMNMLEAVRFNKAIITHDIAELEQHRSTKEIVENKKEWEAAGKKMEEIKAAELLTDAEVYRLEKEIKLRGVRIAELEASVLTTAN